MTAGIEVHDQWLFSSHVYTPFEEDWQDLRAYAVHLGFVTLYAEWRKGGAFEFFAPLIGMAMLGALAQWWISNW